MRNMAYGILAILLIAAAVQWTICYPLFPDTVASHFGLDGQPNGHMPKLPFALLMMAIQFGMPLMFVGIGYMIRTIPASMVNIPHREYWLAPERREETFQHMQSMMAWIGALTSGLVLAMVHLTYIANRDSQSLDTRNFAVFLGVYLAAVFVVAGKSLWRFQLPKQASGV